jgi:hypothetical protein
VPALRNQKHEKFAQGIAKGLSGTDAYFDAGYAVSRKTAGVNASRLLARDDVKARIDELAGKKRGRIAIEQVADSVRTGRPTLYRPELAELARRLALLGLTNNEMASAMNVEVGAIQQWKVDHPEFRKAIERGGVHADAKVAQSTYHRALGYRAPAVKIMQHEGEPIIVPYTEHYPPDTQAARLWLTNRQPEKWRDRRDVNVTGTIEQRIMAMTPEERVQDAIELAERIRAHLARSDPRVIEHEDGEGKK